jgi:hypothetical protein
VCEMVRCLRTAEKRHPIYAGEYLQCVECTQGDASAHVNDILEGAHTVCWQ